MNNELTIICLELYGGLKMADMLARKRLSPTQNLFSCMGFTERAANEFCITQAQEKISRENPQNEQDIKQVYLIVGHTVRQAITELGATMPEDLPLSAKNRIKYRKQTRQ